MPRPDHRSERSDRGGVTRLLAAALVLGLLGSASAQGSRPLELVDSAAAPAGEAGPDVWDRISRWFDRSVTDINQGLKNTFRERPSPSAGRQRETTGLAGSPASPLRIDIIAQRQRCEPAANGAPDCPRAAEVACRSRGYATGRSLETQSERICTPPPLFGQQASRRSGCRTEAYVVRAICQ